MVFFDFVKIIVVSLIAGFFGVLVMTISQTIEMKIRSRKASFTPAIGVSKILKINFEKLSQKNKIRLNNAVHWIYGTFFGLFLLIFYFLGFNNVIYMILIYFLVVWIQGLIVLPVLKLASPPWKWKKSDIFFDAFHHFVLAIITVLAYVILNSSSIFVAIS